MRSFLHTNKMVRGIIMASLFASAVQVQATNWIGGPITEADSNIDTNFSIRDANLVFGPVRVEAINQDVTATIGTFAVLRSSDGLQGGGQIHISAAAGRTVFFDLTNNDLTFFGAIDNETRLLVSFSGQGQLVFILGDGKQVLFTADEATSPGTIASAGTNFFVVMNETGSGPTVTFTRADDDSAENVEVVVGRDSTITYLADMLTPGNTQAVGAIQFDPANLNSTGCMILRILDGASVDISGHLVDRNTFGQFTNLDVEWLELGGLAAKFNVINGGIFTEPSVANLTVINSNTQLPRLRSEPFCDNSFSGHVKGFVLGANGVLTTNNATYLDYVGCSTNACPWVRSTNCPVFDDTNDALVSDPDNAPLIRTVRRAPTQALKRSACNVGSCDLDCDALELLCTLSPLPPCIVCNGPAFVCDCIPFITADDCLVKARNASAFFVDGLNRQTSPNPDLVAAINMEGCSGIYFRSGVDRCGNCNEQDGFVINPCGFYAAFSNPGAGNVVFDVEGRAVVQGDSANANVLRLLSAQVSKSGCPTVIATEATCPTLTVFPALTRNKDDNNMEYLRYNRGAFLINNRLELHDVSLVHTDDNHHILERDDLDRGDPRIFSEPSYIGGEFKEACKSDAPRPTIALYDSIVRFHESAGFTGVDIQVPNDAAGNNSALKFYNNGACVDRGTGRILILGTDHGDRSCSTGALIDHNAHLDVFQTTDQMTTSSQVLRLQTGKNDPCFTLAVDAPVTSDQCSVQTIYLGNESNISIGTGPGTQDKPAPVFEVPTTPRVIIDGAFFSFETHGGSVHLPELTGTIGQGAIFVDTNGVFENTDRIRASISTMVVRSGNGVIDLPETEIFFDTRVGVTDWQPNMNVDNVLVKTGEVFSDFTIDWMQVQTDCNAFVPYDPKLTPTACHCPAVTAANLDKLPTILGTVDQLQIKRSRLGDQVSLLVGPGGFVRELVFLSGFNSGEAPMGTVVVEGWGRVGLGSAHRNVDSLDASIKLGINGVTVIAKGNGIIELNEDIIIDNVCHIMPGPDFGMTGTSETLVFFSEDSREFRVKSTGVLDLSGFKGRNQLVEFGGNIRLVFEPGAQLLLSNVAGEENRTRLRFTDTMSINFERVFDTAVLANLTPNALDERLVKFIGNGDITMKEGATLLLPNDTFLGIETNGECNNFTDIRWTLNDQASFNVGNDNDLGGTFQVGNRANVQGATVNFSLILDGIGALFQIKRQGLVLFGVGGASVIGTRPNAYTYQCLNNVGNVSITIPQGTFSHNQIFNGEDKLAALMVVGPAASYTFGFDVTKALVRGGGNLALVDACSLATFPIVVRDFNGRLLGGNSVVGLFASKDMLRDRSVFPTPFTGMQTVSGRTPTQLFDYLKVQTYLSYFSPKSTFALNQLNLPTLGFVTNNTVINRFPTLTLSDSSGIDTDFERSLRRGAVNISVVDSTAEILDVQEITGAL